MYGWHGRLLRVNLSDGAIHEEKISDAEAQKYIGGRGLAIKYLLEGMNPQTDPLSPENLLAMATGPLTSTPAPTGNRYMVVTKSPLTGALSNSNSGGIFPTMMKRSGYDLFIFEGRAEKPVYLYVDERRAELREAAHLWGLDTHPRAGVFPTFNFQFGQFEGTPRINGPFLRENFLIRHTGCYACPLACARLTEVKAEEWGDQFAGKGEGPEYESIGSLGSACGIDNMAAVTKAKYLCNELGLDTMSTGLTIACAMEMYAKGALTEEQIGRPLPFGDAEGLLDMVRRAATREGFGDDIARGSWRLAKKYGHPEMSVTAKKLEFPSYDARGLKGMGLLCATSNIGASHMAGDTAYMELFGVGERIDGLAYEGKAALVKYFQDLFTIIDAVGLCVFVAIRYTLDTANGYKPTRLTEMVKQATGAGYTPENLLEAADRIYTLERLFLTKAGFSRSDDTLAPRMFEPMPAGPIRGEVFDLDLVLGDYYVERGWDANGVPTRAKLKSLDIAQYD